MARQPKTAQPKAKFIRPCVVCGNVPRRVVTDGRLVTDGQCEHSQVTL